MIAQMLLHHLDHLQFVCQQFLTSLSIQTKLEDDVLAGTLTMLGFPNFAKTSYADLFDQLIGPLQSECLPVVSPVNVVGKTVTNLCWCEWTKRQEEPTIPL